MRASSIRKVHEEPRFIGEDCFNVLRTNIMGREVSFAIFIPHQRFDDNLFIASEDHALLYYEPHDRTTTVFG